MAATACASTASQLGPRLETVRRLSAGVGGNQQLSTLDVSADGRLGREDWAVFDAVHAAAVELAVSRGVSLAHREALYGGPAKDVPSVFSLLAWKDGSIDASQVPKERILELVVESRWMGLQARVGAMATNNGPLDGRVVSGMLQGRVANYNAEGMEPAAICSAFEALPVEDLAAGGIPVTAVFDLDGTVWEGNVMDPFLAALIDLKLPRAEANLQLQAFLKTLDGVDGAAVDGNSVLDNARLFLARATDPSLPKAARVNAKDSFYNIVGLLQGLSPQDARAAARHAYEEGAGAFPAWPGRFFADSDGCSMRRVVATLQERGVEVYLLSATLDPLALEGGRQLGVPAQRVLGSLLEIKDGRFTGKVRDSTYYTKAPIVRQWLPAPPLLAFGDSPTSDFMMLLEATGAAFMINPRAKLTDRDRAEAGGRMVPVRFEGIESTVTATGVGSGP